MSARILVSHYHKVAESHKGVFIGPYTGRTHDKVKWQCAKGHEFEMQYSIARRGHWCSECQCVPECKYYNLAVSRGGLFVGPYTGKTTDKVSWKCKKGHIWQAMYNNVCHNKQWCPVCNINSQKNTMEDCYNLAAPHGGECLESEYKTGATNMRWRCAQGHEWLATYQNISKGKWCPWCAGNVRLTTAFVQEQLLGFGNGFQLIGEYVNCSTPMQIRCMKCGGEFQRIWETFRDGSYGCNHCGSYKLVNGIRASKPQIKIAQLLQAEDYINYRVGRKSIDVALPKQNIAVEYDCMY